MSGFLFLQQPALVLPLFDEAKVEAFPPWPMVFLEGVFVLFKALLLLKFLTLLSTLSGNKGTGAPKRHDLASPLL